MEHFSNYKLREHWHKFWEHFLDKIFQTSQYALVCIIFSLNVPDNWFLVFLSISYCPRILGKRLYCNCLLFFYFYSRNICTELNYFIFAHKRSKKNYQCQEPNGTSPLDNPGGSATYRWTDGIDLFRAMLERPDLEVPEDQRETGVHAGRQEIWDPLASRDI